MGSFATILEQLDERYIAKKIGIPHDEARASYRLATNTAADIDKFRQIIGDYYNYHFTTCVSRGGNLPAAEAQGKAKGIVEQVYRSRGSDFVGAYNDAHEGTNGGLRIILDAIAQHLKEEAIEHHITKVLDDEIKPNSWNDKVDIIRQFINYCGPGIATYLDTSEPELYAQNYTELIRAYIDSIRKTSSMFRRM